MTTRTLRLCLATLSVALCCLGSNPKSETDQYGTHILYQSHPPRSFGEAYKVIKSEHRFDLHPKTLIRKEGHPLANDIVPDLQVDSGDGLLVETITPTPVIPKHKKIFPKKERRKRDVNNRQTRSHFVYNVRTPTSYSYTLFKPHMYKLERPYYIPVLGAKGSVPIYFPPQPVFINPGFPSDNPTIFYESPDRGYLPPSKPSMETTTTPETVTVGFRDGTIWDSMPVGPSASTTRRPNVLSSSTFPPLVHNPDPNMPNRRPTARTTTTPTRTTTTTVLPPPTLSSAQENPEANRIAQPATNQCAWAIVSCCSVGSKKINNSCFERLGCPGPFWDSSPCENEYANNALNYAMQYYQDR